MPMNAATLGAAMNAAMNALSDTDKANRSKTFEALATAIVEHVKTHAQINGTAAVGLASPSGPVTGAVILPPGSIT